MPAPEFTIVNSQSFLEHFVNDAQWRNSEKFKPWSKALARVAVAHTECLALHPDFVAFARDAYWGPLDRLQQGPIEYRPPAVHWNVEALRVGGTLEFAGMRNDVLETLGDFFLRARDDLRRLLAEGKTGVVLQYDF